jgi:hypothetical protein
MEALLFVGSLHKYLIFDLAHIRSPRVAVLSVQARCMSVYLHRCSLGASHPLTLDSCAATHASRAVSRSLDREFMYLTLSW